MQKAMNIASTVQDLISETIICCVKVCFAFSYEFICSIWLLNKKIGEMFLNDNNGNDF